MIDNSVMKPICNQCLQEIDQEAIGKFNEINCDLKICWDCLERQAYGIDECKITGKHYFDCSCSGCKTMQNCLETGKHTYECPCVKCRNEWGEPNKKHFDHTPPYDDVPF